MTEYYLGVRQVAERLGITSGGLLNLKLPEPDVMIGRTREWKPETIDAWNAARPGRSVGGGTSLQACQLSCIDAVVAMLQAAFGDDSP